MRHAAAQVHAAGLMLVIEVDCNTSKRTGDLVRAVNHAGLQVNWDPANAYRAGDDVPFPDAYAEVREYVRHVHFKDARTYADGKRSWTLGGIIDWAGQIKALQADGFDGYISVEPRHAAQYRRLYISPSSASAPSSLTLSRFGLEVWPTSPF